MSTIFLHRLASPRFAKRADVVLVLADDQSFDSNDFRDALVAELDENGFPDQLIFFVTNEDFSNFVSSLRSDVRREDLGRLEGKTSVFVRGFAHDGRIVSDERIGKAIAGHDLPAIELLESHRPVITSLFMKNKCDIGSSRSFHFSLPSGRFHVDKFIRVSRLLTDSAEIRYLATSLLPYMEKNTRIVYIDTPALFPLVSALSDLLRRFDAKRQGLIGVNFRSHVGVNQAKFKSHSVVVISCSATGWLADIVRNKGRYDFGEVIHFLWASKDESATPVACNLTYHEDVNPDGYARLPELHLPENCPLCSKGSFAIRLAGDNFELPVPQPLPVNPIRGDAPAGLTELMARYAESGIFQLGLAQNWTEHPREFFISPPEMMKSGRFIDRLDYLLLNGLPAGTNTVVYMNDRSKQLAEYVTRSLPTASLISRDELAELRGEQGVAPVAVVSAVVESGRSLNDITRDLRKFFPKSTHCFVVGFVKHVSEQALRTLRNSLIKTNAPANHKFICVEQIVLPLSTQQNAWELELRFLKGLDLDRPEIMLEKPFFAERKAILSQRAKPLGSGLFVRNRDDLPLDLTPGFIFWPENMPIPAECEASVYYTVCSVMQNLRSIGDEAPTRGLRNDLFQQTLLDPKAFRRFNDGLIQAALLRAARPAELNYETNADYSTEMGRTLGSIFRKCNGYRGSAAAEFLLAILSKRMTLVETDLRNALEAIPVDAPTRLRFLRELAIHG